MKSLAKAFKEVYGEALKEYGFKKVKGKYPYYARMVGDEIVQVITFATRPKQRDGFKEYIVLGGVATVYRAKINFDIPVTQNFAWLSSELEFYKKSNKYLSAEDYKKAFENLYTFSYEEDSEILMVESLKKSLVIIKDIVLPTLNKINSLRECIDFFGDFHPGLLVLNEYTNNLENYSDFAINEGLVQIKVFTPEQFDEYLKRVCAENEKHTRHLIKIGLSVYTEKMIKEEQNIINEYINNQTRIFFAAINNQSSYNKLINELERRKENNTEILKEYGVID